jgi:hypothetical protein
MCVLIITYTFTKMFHQLFALDRGYTLLYSWFSDALQYLKMMTNMPIGHPFRRPAV